MVKKCKYCGKDLEDEFMFCPYCGHDLKEMKIKGFGFYSPFLDMFDSVSDTFRGVDELFEIPDINLDEVEKDQQAKMSGIDINISNVGGKPDVKVNTWGDFKKYEPEILKKLGAKSYKEAPSEKEEIEKASEEVLDTPPKYEEVKGTNIRRLGDRIIYEFDMPGIVDVKDVRIRKLESSYEIRALGKDNAYFKLLPLNFELQSYKVEDGKVIMEFSVA